MSKTTGNKENFRVIIEPRGLGNFGHVRTSDSFIYGHGKEAEARIARDYQDRCDEIVAEVKRHVDNIGSVYVEYDQDAVCEHCGDKWTEDSDTYNGGCCEKDQQAEENRLDLIAKEQP
jgi:hypothetical protein